MDFMVYEASLQLFSEITISMDGQLGPFVVREIYCRHGFT